MSAIHAPMFTSVLTQTIADPPYYILLAGAKEYYSNNGSAWNEQVITNRSWSDIAWNGAIYVAIADGSNHIIRSSDGLSWNDTTTLTSSSWKSIAYGNGVFCSVSYNADKCTVSTNGIDWDEYNLPATTYHQWVDISFNGSVFCAIQNTQAHFATSVNGQTWNQGTLPTARNWLTIGTDGNNFVITCNSNRNTLVSTDNGSSWTEHVDALPYAYTWNSIAYGNGRYCVAGYGTNKAAWSEDGIVWTEATLPSTQNWSKMKFTKEKFILYADNSTAVAISDNGADWSSASLPSNPGWVLAPG